MAEAAEKAGNYEFTAAALLYQDSIERIDSDHYPLEAARVTGLLAQSHFKGAFQSGSREKFRLDVQLAVSGYERTASLYQTAGSEHLSKMAEARGLFAAFWLNDDLAGKRNIIDRCIALAEEAGRAFDYKGEKRHLAAIYLDLFNYRKEALNLASERKLLVDLFEAALDIGWKVIGEFDELRDDQGLLESIHSMILLYVWAANVLEPPALQELEKKIGKLRGRIAEVSERIRTPFALSLTDELGIVLTGDFDAEFVKALNMSEKALVRAEATKDSFLIGRMFTTAAGIARWPAMSEEYVERRRELLEKAVRYAAGAIKNLEISSHGSWLKTAYTRYVEVLNDLALIVETDAEKKKTRLGEAVEIARRGMAYENHTLWVSSVGHELSKAMYLLASVEEDPREKTRLLAEALPVRAETVRIHDLLSISWSRGVMFNYSALLKAELSSTEEDPRRKSELLQDAFSDMQQCVELCARGTTATTFMHPLALYEESYGDIGIKLHRLRAETPTFQQAIKSYEDAIEHLTKSQNPGPIAPVRWKIARAYDTIGDFGEASRHFRQAAEEYRLGVKRAPGLASTFEDIGTYMDAWAMIEDARLHHEGEEYLPAADDYTKAATLLETTRGWSHLSKHYTACSFLERGEAQSRQERQHASIESFDGASKTFREAKAELENKLGRGLGFQEKRELKDWLEITEGRAKYSLGRVELEEAKILDKKGEEEASSRKYRSASHTFRALLAGAEVEQSQRELETLTLVCDAWAKMKEAEARASPELYAEAADSFVKVENLTTKKRFRLLALANASMCRALEAGTRFRRTRDTQLYADIKKQLETAADYYDEAGIHNASDWTRATQRLFDALIYLADAETEKEPRKKTELFHLAEKHLQLAARLYGEAGFSRKKEETLRHLERAREEKELLMMPVEALAENPAVSEVAVAPLSLLRDTPVGLERFETANVVGSLSIPRGEMHVGEDLTFDLEMSNVGRTTATIIKIENIASKGLELERGMIPYSIEDHVINMRGKRLEYQKTHQVKIPLKALRKGTYELRPRIVFADEKGNQSSYDFEPVAVRVRELGIAGWIRGPSR